MPGHSIAAVREIKSSLWATAGGKEPHIRPKRSSQAKLVEARCDAIDLNLGCPQRVAFAGNFGSFLLDEEDRALLLRMVRTVSRGISIPLFVKIRLLAGSPCCCGSGNRV